MAAGRRVVAVAYGRRSVPAMQLIEAAGDRWDLVWLIDPSEPGIRSTARILGRFGPVVEAPGFDSATAVAGLAAHRPEGLVTYFDTGLVELAATAEALDLPFHSPEAARALSDKAVQRRALARAGLDGPGSWELSEGPVEEALRSATATARWPVVLKPKSESGSRHTFLAEDLAQAVALMNGLAGQTQAMVVEEYLEGPSGWDRPIADYVSVESIVAAGRIRHLAVTGRLPPAPIFRETGFFVPSDLAEDEKEAVLRVAEQAISGLGVTNGCLHTEIKLSDSSPRVIEVNGRMGGGIPDMVELAAGYDLLEASLQLAVGQDPGGEGLLPCRCVGYRLFLQPPQITAVIDSVEGAAQLLDHPGVKSVTSHLGPGDPVDWRDGSRTFILAVVGRTSHVTGVLDVYRTMHEQVKVHYAG